MTGSIKRSCKLCASALYRFCHACLFSWGYHINFSSETTILTCAVEYSCERPSVGSARVYINLSLCCWHSLHQSPEDVSLLNDQVESTDLIFMSSTEQSHRGEQHLPHDPIQILQSGFELFTYLVLVPWNLIMALLLISENCSPFPLPRCIFQFQPSFSLSVSHSFKACFSPSPIYWQCCILCRPSSAC